MDLGIQGKKALVMASSQGLGKAVAQELVREGAQVILSSRNLEALEAAAKEVGAVGVIPADLAEKGAAAALVEAAADQLGGLDILVTNAGGPPSGTFADITEEQWSLSFQELFSSVTEAVRAGIPFMAEENWGRIVMITSIAGKEPIHNLTISNALRAGLHGLMNTLSKELGPQGITVNAVLPSFTATDRLKHLGADLSKLAEGIPVGRIGDPEDFGKLVVYLCSVQAGFISGQAVGFDGGSMQGI